MMDWWLDTSGFMPRNACGPGWSEALRSVSTASNTIIFVCYMVIPFGVIGIYKHIKHGRPIKSQWLGAVLFCAFIFLCGCTHLMDRLMFGWPVYRLTALILAMTAVVSLATVCWLYVAGSQND